ALMAVAPEAQAEYTLETRAPDQPRACANVAPDTKPGYPLRIVSAPDTSWMSDQATPASSSASRAAASPYSTKLRPHFPHGCIPAPRTAMGSVIGGPPLPDEVLVVVVLEQRVDDELDVHPDRQLVDADVTDHLPHDDHLLRRQFHGRNCKRRVRI